MSDKTPAIAVARSREDGDKNIVVLSTGVRARLNPVSASLIEDVSSQIQDPPVPMWYNEKKDREEPNPSDPEYRRLMAENDKKRGVAVMDVIVIMGVELVDGIPDESEWLPKLKFMEKRKMLSLSEYDLTDELEREFLYKRFIAVGNADLIKIGQLSGIPTAEVESAERSF